MEHEKEYGQFGINGEVGGGGFLLMRKMRAPSFTWKVMACIDDN